MVDLTDSEICAVIGAERKNAEAPLRAEIERLRKVLRELSRNYENPDIGHEQFRVAVKMTCDAALIDVEQKVDEK
jgi:hypothetical protein